MARNYTEEYQEIIKESFEIGQDQRQLTYDNVAWQSYTQPNIENIMLVPVKETALDIGCAYGTTSVFLKKIGWNVMGIDITDRYVNKKLFYYLYSPGEIEELCKNANLIIKKQNIEKWLHYLLQKSQLAS